MSLEQQLLELAQKAARHVGERIRHAVENAEQVNIHFKAANDLVTEVDHWSEQEIKKLILASFPDHRVIGEEESFDQSKSLAQLASDAAAGKVVWVIDPIDGTKNFANKIPHVSVSIGVQVNGQRVVGLVYDPCRDEMFSAVKGQGAFLNERAISCSAKMQVSDAMVAIGFPADFNWSRHIALFDTLVRNARGLRVTGSAALDQCWVACGRFDAFLEYNLKPWDIHGGSLIVEEAGGCVSNFAEEIDKPFSAFADSYLCATSEVYKEILLLAKGAKDRP